MKKILVILGNYFPTPSSVATCMQPLLKEMAKKYKVDILTNKVKAEIPDYKTDENISIFTVPDVRVMNTILLNELRKIKSDKFLIFITRIFAFILKGLYYLRYCIFATEKGTGGWSIKHSVDLCEQLYLKNHYDVVISVSLPFISHNIAAQFVQRTGHKVKWIVFEFDPYYYNEELNCCNKKNIYKQEYNVFEKSDLIILTPELYNFYLKTDYLQFKEKMKLLHFSNIQQINYINNDKILLSNNKINCYFAGRIYKKIRDPDYCIKIFSQITSNIHLTMLTNYINEQKNNNDNITVYSFQSKDTAIELMMKANILVNIGNTVELQVPAKIFEYISSGKPIIHFSKMENDPALLYLTQYPLCLVINEKDDIDYSVKKVEEFCFKNCDMQLDFELVKKIMGDMYGDRVSEKFVMLLEEIIINNGYN